MTAAFVTVCCWCSPHHLIGSTEPYVEVGGESHGMCSKAAARMRADLDDYVTTKAVQLGMERLIKREVVS